MKHITVVAAVIEKQGKILCVQRGISSLHYISEKWEFPGGKIELGETEEVALRREIKEELEMEIVVGKKIGTVTHQYPDFLLTMHAFHCTSKQEPTLTEHIAFRWLNIRELENIDWAAADVPVVKLFSNEL
ncbi:MAG: (deoxy)nucleoside triphosphate pyrophosphohydrolase [Bacteroidota bacterium]